MIHFESLASSSAGNAYRVSGGGTKAPILIDCGLSYAELQKALGFRVTELAGCLISHSHGDHCKAAADLLRAGVDVWASGETWEASGHGNHHRAWAILFPESTMDGIMRPTEFSLGDWRVAPFPVIHDCEGTLGFLIGSPEGDRLLYMTDSMYSPFKFEGLTHIAIECNHSLELMRQNSRTGTVDRSRYHRTARTHMSLETVLKMLRANDLSKVEEIHLLHLSSANSDAADFKSQVEKATGCPTFVCAE